MPSSAGKGEPPPFVHYKSATGADVSGTLAEVFAAVTYGLQDRYAMRRTVEYSSYRSFGPLSPNQKSPVIRPDSHELILRILRGSGTVKISRDGAVVENEAGAGDWVFLAAGSGCVLTGGTSSSSGLLFITARVVPKRRRWPWSRKK